MRKRAGPGRDPPAGTPQRAFPTRRAARLRRYARAIAVTRLLLLPMALALLGLAVAAAWADESAAKVADEVNQKLVKLYGAGGFKGLHAYGTGVVISPDGYILTVNSHILDTRDLRIHMA